MTFPVRGWMNLHFGRMQRLTRKSVNLLLRALAAIGRIAHDRMFDMRHMHADLMRAPGRQLAFDEARSSKTSSTL